MHERGDGVVVQWVVLLGLRSTQRPEVRTPSRAQTQFELEVTYDLISWKGNRVWVMRGGEGEGGNKKSIVCGCILLYLALTVSSDYL